jgi:hypothetical protein
MKATKILIVLAATAAISLTSIGVAYGYYVTNPTNINTNSPYATNNDFWGWFGGCLGFRQEPYAYPYQYQYPSNSTTQPPIYVPPQQPYQPQNPNQDYYSYGYRRGCWGW